MRRVTVAALGRVDGDVEVRACGGSARKATAETLKHIEGEFMKAALEGGSAGYMPYYADAAVELPDGVPAIAGKKDWDF